MTTQAAPKPEDRMSALETENTNLRGALSGVMGFLVSLRDDSPDPALSKRAREIIDRYGGILITPREDRETSVIERIHAQAERILRAHPECHEALLKMESAWDLFGATAPLDQIGEAMSQAQFSLGQASGVLSWCRRFVKGQAEAELTNPTKGNS